MSSLSKGNISGSASTSDMESSDVTSVSDGWLNIKDKKHRTLDQTGTGPSTTSREHSTTLGSLSNHQRSGGKGKSSTRALKRGHTAPQLSSDKAPVSRSTSRIDEIEKALRAASLELDTAQATSRQAPKRQARHKVVVVSSDEEGDTDVDYSDAQSHASSTRPPLSNTSSFSSTPSPYVQLSASSSYASLPASEENSQIDSGIQKGPVLDGGSSIYPARNTSGPLRMPTAAETAAQAGQQHVPNYMLRRPNVEDTLSAKDTSATVPQSVLDFSRTAFGTDLPIAVIAHCDDTQRVLDQHQLSWGVQYELARGISAGLWNWEDVRKNIHRLTGTNEHAGPKVERQMKSRNTARASDAKVWKQLDLEQEAIAENIGRALGLMGDFGGVSNWYGGQIQQIGRLGKDGAGFKVKLERMESRRSHRFARYYGSRRFLQIRISDEMFKSDHAAIKRFLLQKFVICGRVYVPFHSKEMKVYLVETDENYGRKSQDWCADFARKSFQDFINWHNPLDVSKNCRQVISKYAARFALGLSNSTPALEFEEKNIHFIEDLTADGWTKGSKNAPADKLMTDGCGFVNHAGLIKIAKALHYSSLPAGVQGRIDGSKGFFILHPTDTSDDPKIWIRDSQDKIQNRSFDRAHRIFDLLCASQSMSSTALTSQLIINLFSNGIPPDMLVHLMEKGLEDEVAPLLEWDKPNAMVFLYDAIAKGGGVSGSRAQRVVYSLNRVLGFTGRDWKDSDGIIDEDGDNMSKEEDEGSTIRNKYSKQPYLLHEVALEMLQAGFHPRNNKLLQEKIQYMVKSIIKASVEKFRIPIAESVGAFIVPDPLGVLEEGEVCFRFSKPRKDPKTEMLLYSLEGEILLGRYPIRLPSDIQKVRAVDKRELDKWPDVLIVSTKGQRSIASLLADGDMDGDEIVAIWDKALVELFSNKPFTNPPDNFIKDNFNKDVESVEQFCDRVSRLPARGSHVAFQEVLIANLSESRVGLYSLMHENATIKYGYNSPDAIRLAYIFATLLDSSKNGCRLKDGLFKRDLFKYGSSSKPNVLRGTPTSDILGLLKEAGKRKGDEILEKYRLLEGAEEWAATDEALLKPFQHAAAIAHKRSERGLNDFRGELDLILRRIELVDDIYRQNWKEYFRKTESQASMSSGAKKSKRSKSDKADDINLECARRYTEPIEGLELIQNVEEVKASYAYLRKPNLAFAVAFNELCLLKASASPGGIVPSTRIFDEARTSSGSFLRALGCTEERHLEARI